MELVKKFLDLETGVPEEISLAEMASSLMVEDENGLKPSLTTVLIQEVERFNTLLRIARNSLEKLEMAINGTISMSQKLDEVYQSFLKRKVPLLWENYAYPSLKPLHSWVEDLRMRIAFITRWVKKGNPLHYWLPGLFFPHGYLTGVLQTYSREETNADEKIAIDRLKFEFAVVDLSPDELTEPPEVSRLNLKEKY